MSIAAVPQYLGTDFTHASPGMRFGLLLPIWTTRKDQEDIINERANRRSKEATEIAQLLRERGMDEVIRAFCARANGKLPSLWGENDDTARDAWKKVSTLTQRDRALMGHLAQRQNEAAMTLPTNQWLNLQATNIAPFVTGLGNEHPLENGFAFLNPYGIPYLPGSGVKGVLRQAARELGSGKWGDTKGWCPKETFPVTIAGKDVKLSVMDVLFGRESEQGDTEHVRGVLQFWDVIPQIKGDRLAVEVMTPHQSHYYQQPTDNQPENTTSPHDSGAPNPIFFLSVPPDSSFSFHVVCDEARLRGIAPALSDNNRWQNLLIAAFEHAFRWLGFGAKTAVGYGAMSRDHGAETALANTAEQRRKEEEQNAQRLAARAAKSAAANAIEDLKTTLEKKAQELKARKLALYGAHYQACKQLIETALASPASPDWTPEEKRQLADIVEEWLPKVESIADIKKIGKDKLRFRELRSVQAPA